MAPMCVELDAAEVSGRHFIELAAQQHPQVNQYEFGENAERALCMLADIGTTDESCLDGGPYWGYWRSDGSGWYSSRESFVDTRVGDGDLEGWSWANGYSRPSHPSFKRVCGYDPHEQSPDGPREGGEDPVNPDPSDSPETDDTDVSGIGGSDGGGTPSGPSDSKPGPDPKKSRIPGDFPSAEPEPNERLIDSAPDESELTVAPTPETVETELPPSATTAGNEPEEFPLAGALALIATFAMAGVAVLLVRKRAPVQPKE